MFSKPLKVPNNGVRAVFNPDTYNEDDNTVDIVIATETPVRRRDYDGQEFIEVLVCNSDSVMTDRLDGGNVSLVDTHDTYSVRSVFGRVVSYRFEGNTLVGTVLLATRDDVKGIIQDVRAGVIKNCSVGYNIVDAVFAGQDGDVPIVRVVKWQPTEVSLCAVNVDAKSSVRSQKPEDYTEIPLSNDNESITNNSQNTHTVNMTDAEKQAIEAAKVAQPDANAAPVVAMPESGSRATVTAVEAERTRAAQITERVRAAKLAPEFAQTLIESGVSYADACVQILTKYESESGQRAISGVSVATTVGKDREQEGRIEAMTDALVMRAEPGIAKTEKDFTTERVRAAQQYRNLSLLEMARMSAERANINTRDIDKMELVKRAITSSTSDFPVLLDGTARRVLLNGYNSVADTWRQFCRVGSVSDFREWKRLRLGSLANLQVVAEGQEYKNKKISDADYEKISVQTWGDILNVSRQMIINDDLAGFAQLSAQQGRAAARTIEARVYALIAANPVMADGNTLFHASHGNIAGTAAAPSVASVEAAALLMGQQKDKNGNDFLDLTPSIWLGSQALRGDVNVLNDSAFDVSVSNKFQVPNKVRGMYSKVIGTPRLSGTAWYSLCDPNIEPVFEVAFLDGQETPYMETEKGFDVDGMRWKTRLDFDAAAIGWKGIVKNAGA